MANKFLNSVANIVLRDVDTGEAIAYGKTNISSSISQTMQMTEARGGIGNNLLFQFFHSRDVEISIEMATFNQYILALQSGQSVVSGNVSVVETECVVLADGEGTLTYTPTGDVTFIFDDNDAAVTVTPSGSDITVAGGLARKGVAIYDRTVSADRITVEVGEPPSIVELIMTAEVYESQTGGSVAEYFQVVVPNFQLDGNYELSLNADGVSTQPLNGRALEVPATDCSSGAYYYTATWIDVAAETAPYIALAATPSPMTLSGAEDSSQISVLGIRSVLYTNETITDECAFEVTSGCATIEVGSLTGLVSSSATALSGDNAIVTASYWDVTSGSLTDTVSVVVE
jgi:hypothetical protein